MELNKTFGHMSMCMSAVTDANLKQIHAILLYGYIFILSNKSEFDSSLCWFVQFSWV
jgi:hypothetical protein